MFLTLGLLVFPTQLIDVALEAGVAKPKRQWIARRAVPGPGHAVTRRGSTVSVTYPGAISGAGEIKRPACRIDQPHRARTYSSKMVLSE